ncbi:porin [Shinella sp. CPCC 101442]|uniref:porin n=1 Tax=Shinella sp. CPCC 101442 TaxID=2932265 RepID=UPI0021539319|nr:porin [Shinella sp. CPCC 101442]MCR6502084.1 porin [Shinella sp. CPCC 101442]
MRRLLAYCMIASCCAGFQANADDGKYLKVCDTWGEGYFVLPGSETCLKISGSLTFDLSVGEDVYSSEPLGRVVPASSASIDFSTASETDLGALRSVLSIDLDEASDEGGGVTLSEAVLELNGLLVGATSSQFDLWLNSAGAVLSDDVIAYGPSFTNLISYTTSFDELWSAMVGVEQGETRDDFDFLVHGGVPHAVAGIRLGAERIQIGSVMGYDSVREHVAAKVRLDLEITDSFSTFAMVGYRSGHNEPGYFGTWEGRFAAWAGFSLDLSEELVLNSQAAYTDTGKYAIAASFDYVLLPSLLISTELAFTSLPTDEGVRDSAIGGLLSIEREF